MRTTAIAALALLLVGCAGAGALKPEKIIAATAEGVPEFYSGAEWLPDTQGFMQERTLVAAYPREGVLVLTPMSVMFLQWAKDEQRYRPMWRLPYSDVESFRIDALGVNRRLVIHTKDFRVHSFGVFRDGSRAVDIEKTREAIDLLQRHTQPADLAAK